MEREIRWLGKSFLIIFMCLSVVSLFGCETLRKKFTRRSKAEKEQIEEVVYEPQEYPAQILSNEDRYRNHYTFWRGWHQELTEVLAEGQNHKKQVECVREIINNLNKMKELLLPEAQAPLEGYIQGLIPIRDEIIAGRSNAANFYSIKARLESIGRKITRDYTTKKIKPYLIR